MLCERCQRVLEPEVAVGAKMATILRAFNLGDRTLGQLALAVYGRDTSSNRRKVSGLIRKCLRDVLEPVDGKGTWRLATARTPVAEAAE